MGFLLLHHQAAHIPPGLVVQSTGHGAIRLPKSLHLTSLVAWERLAGPTQARSSTPLHHKATNRMDSAFVHVRTGRRGGADRAPSPASSPLIFRYNHDSLLGSVCP